MVFVPRFFDVEVSNLCNATCAFCPRDAMTRPKGRMSEETFDLLILRLKALVRRMENGSIYLTRHKVWGRMGAAERLPVSLLFCGMGECLTHDRAPEWVGRIRSEVGVRAGIVTNGALLTERIVKRLMAADVTAVTVSVHGVDRESYRRYVQLDWDIVLGNVERAHAMLEGRVAVTAVVPRGAPYTESDVREFWKPRGIPVCSIVDCHSRGGFMKATALISAPGPTATPTCAVMAGFNFIAWDGRVLSCCHDLEGENVIGSVHADEMVDIFKRKTEMINSGAEPAMCERCDDPVRAQLGYVAMMKAEDVAQ